MQASSLLRALQPLSGLLFWAVQFSLIYAATALACARGGERFSFHVSILIAASTLLALAGTAGVFLRAWRSPEAGAAPADAFLNALTLWANGLAFIAILWNALPAVLLPVCA